MILISHIKISQSSKANKNPPEYKKKINNSTKLSIVISVKNEIKDQYIYSFYNTSH